ncbi:MAG: hypothetical protein BWY82_01147 [Verrucomicrobia bacterium ADurb.Bin474]|nr:MAG: hypothetical protein BWY82_01147 [Verrucomicrobia bacterium ADurb.Bin474]
MKIPIHKHEQEATILLTPAIHDLRVFPLKHLKRKGAGFVKDHIPDALHPAPHGMGAHIHPKFAQTLHHPVIQPGIGQSDCTRTGHHHDRDRHLHPGYPGLLEQSPSDQPTDRDQNNRHNVELEYPLDGSIPRYLPLSDLIQGSEK